MSKILIICGPTATGKTDLALTLAEKFSWEILSADSRQVYKALDIGTGKDVPKGFELRVSEIKDGKGKIPYYANENIRVWGYDLMEPNLEYSVSQYASVAKKILKDVISRKKLPIIVGGSGLYIKAVTSGIETSGIPRNRKLREFLEKKNADEVYEILAQNDPVKAGSLNSSDRKNKRRLIRAIEISKWKEENKRKVPIKGRASDNFDYLFVGLTADNEFLKRRIEKRVDLRMEKGFQEEVERLLFTGISWNDQSMQGLGYKQIKDYFLGKDTKGEFIQKWKDAEVGYMKRQKTWFNKEKRISWFDISHKGFENEVEKKILEWHND